jgi:hypothetical protein
MPCLLVRRSCKACGQLHDFFLCGETLNMEERYEYQCPVTGRKEFLWEIKRVESVPELYCPSRNRNLPS